MRSVKTSAPARAGLLGNPSDLYGGRGIGFAIAGWRAELELSERDCAERSEETPRDGDELLAAAWEVFRAHALPGGAPTLAAQGLAARFRSDVPRQVGLAGSSAIVLAGLRALAAFFAVPLEPLVLARLTLAAEVDVLGIRAGPMDRLVQAHGGLVALDFAVPFAPGSVQRLDPALAPPMLVAWDPEPKKTSGAVHAPVWQRWQDGDPLVHAVLAEFRPLVERGLAALLRGDRAELLACVNRNFDLRARIFTIGERDRAMIEIGRALGAATKFCGSGGAILAVVHDARELAPLAEAYARAGFSHRVVQVDPS